MTFDRDLIEYAETQYEKLRKETNESRISNLVETEKFFIKFLEIMNKANISQFNCIKFASLINNPENIKSIAKVKEILKYVRIYLDLVNEDYPEPNPKVIAF